MPRRYYISSSQKTVEINLPEVSSIDRWSSRAALWAQVLTLGVVIFGYIYTVVPVFQKERLGEEVAKLKLERAKSVAQIKSMDSEANKAKNELRDLQKSKNAITVENKILRDKQKDYLVKINLSHKSLAKVNSMLHSAQANLINTRRLYIDLARKMFEYNTLMYFAQATPPSPYNFDRNSSYDDVYTQLSKRYGNPTNDVNHTVSKIKTDSLGKKYNDEEQKRVSHTLLSEFLNNYESKKDKISVEKIDAQLWASSYSRQMRMAKLAVKSCEKRYWVVFANVNNWTKTFLHEVLNNKEYAQFKIENERSFAVDCENQNILTLEWKFNRSIIDFDGAYAQWLLSIPGYLMGHGTLRTIPPKAYAPPKYLGPWMPTKKDFTSKTVLIRNN